MPNDARKMKEDLILPPIAPSNTNGRHDSARSSKTLSPNWLRQRDETLILPLINNANNWRGKLQKLRQLKNNGPGNDDIPDDKRFTTSNTPFGMHTRVQPPDTQKQQKLHRAVHPLAKAKADDFNKFKNKKLPPMAAQKPLIDKLNSFIDPDIITEEKFNNYLTEIQQCNNAYVVDYLRAMSKASRNRKLEEIAAGASPEHDTETGQNQTENEGHNHLTEDEEFGERRTRYRRPINPMYTSFMMQEADSTSLPALPYSLLNRDIQDASNSYAAKLSKLSAITRQDIETKLARRDYALLDESFFKPVGESSNAKSSMSKDSSNRVGVGDRELREILAQKRRKKFINMKDAIKAPKYGLVKPRNVVYNNSFHGILGQDTKNGGWTFTETFKSRKNLEIFEP